ncbi:hypothetical protein [Ferriphaselus sp. R-1]|nr:hypothetical protein [Ferriphaselus sp. R-1]
MRLSNTTPVITLCFESDNAVSLQRVKEDFRRALLSVNPALNLPF